MQLGYIQNLFKEGLYCIHEEFDSWESAILASAQPLIDKGYVEPEYAESILHNVAEFGPYIFLAPHLCMPHSKAVQYVHKPCICFMKVNKPVKYDPDDPVTHAELFFTIASPEAGKHLDFIETLVEIFEDDETMDALLACKTEEDFFKLLSI